MTNEEKILELLTRMQSDISGLKGEVSGLKTGQDQLHEEVHRIKAYLEGDVEKRFDAVNEGMDAIMEKLDTLNDVKELAEETKDRVDVIYAVVKQHSGDITKLKKVQ